MRVFFKYFIFVFFFTFLLSACSDEKEEMKNETNLEFFGILDVFDEKQSTQSVTFSAPTVWIAQTDQSWCTVMPDKGNAGMNTVKVSVQPTSDYDERNASLTIVSGSKKKTMTITQKQKDALLLTSSKKEMPAEGGMIEVEVKSNVNFSYSVDAASVEWIVPVASRGLDSKIFRFKVKNNEDNTKREGFIVFYNETLREEFHVYQQGTTPELILTQNEYTVSDKGGNIKVELKSNFDYEVKMPDVGWVKEMGNRSSSTYTHYFTVSPNTAYDGRSTKIEFVQKETGVSETVTINQAQKSDILIDKSEYAFDFNGGRLTLDVQSNIEFTVVSEEPWIVQHKSKGLQKSQFLFDVKQNLAELTREGSIIIKSDQITKKVKVVQEGNPDYAIKLIKSLVPFGSKAETQDLVIQTMEDWTLYSKTTWAHVSPRSGAKGEHVIKVQVDPITAVPERVDSVYITAGKSSLTIPILQQNEDDLMILTHNAHVGGKRDTIINVLLKSSYDVKFEVDDFAKEWIVPISSRSLTTTELQFKILKTNKATERKGIIHFKIGGKEQDFTVTQDGIGLKMVLPADRYDFDYSARDFDITVEANFKHRPWFPDNPRIQYLKSEELSTNEGMTKVKHYFHFQENSSLYMSTSTIFFLNEEFEDLPYKTDYFFKVLQSNRNTIDFNKTSFEVSSSGGQVEVEVQSNVKYVMKPDQPWIKLLKESHRNNSIYYLFDIAPNNDLEERKGAIVFSFADSKKYVNIIQEGYSDFGIIVTTPLESFGTAGGTQNLVFRASDKWSVTSDQDWCSVSPNSGDRGNKNTMKVTVAANDTYGTRTAKLTFKCGKYTETIPVVQKQLDHVEFPQTQYTAAWNQTALDVMFKANCPYEVAVNQPWVKLVPKNKGLVDEKVSFTLEKNMGDVSRDAVLTFSYLNKKQDIKLTQKCMDSLDVSIQNMTVEGANDTIIKLKVKSTGAVTYKIAENATAWIVPVESRALTENEYAFKVLKSAFALDRKGVITFISGTKNASCTITQKGLGLVMDFQKEKQIDNKAQKVEVIVKSNFKYKTILDGSGLIQELPTQFVPSDEEGYVTTKHTFSVPQNETLDARNFDITFVNTEFLQELGEDRSHKFRISQMGTNTIFVASGTQYSIPVEGKVLELVVSSNVKYQVKISEPSWIEQIPDSKGLTTDKLRFNIHKNMNTKSRTGIITLFGEGCKTEVNVTQEAFDDYGIIIHEPKPTKFETEGGEQVLKFNSSLDWVASTSEKWCKLNVTKGTAGENKEIIVSVSPNTNKTDRKANVILMAGANHKQTVEIVQRQKDYIEVPTKVQNVGWEKKQLTLNVKANCDYKVNYTEDWIKTIKQDQQSLVVEVEENNQIQPRETTLTLVYEDITKEVTVKQAGAPASIEVESEEVNTSWQTGVEKVKVTANCPYEVKSGADWVKAKKTAEGLDLNISENQKSVSRNTMVTLTYGSIEKKIKVVQEGQMSIEIESKNMTVNHESGVLVVKVKANTDYKVGFSDVWLHEVSHSSTELVLNIDENLSFEQRVATVQLTPIRSDIKEAEIRSITFKVTQTAQTPELTVTDTNKTIACNDTKVSINVKTNVDYTVDIASNDGEWLTGPKKNKETLELTATENKVMKPRTATVTLKSTVGGIEQKVIVTQKESGPIIEVNPVTVNVGPEANTKEVAVNANCDYTVESKADWVSVAKNEEGKLLTLTIKKNFTAKKRNAVVTFAFESTTTSLVVNQGAGEPVEINVTNPEPVAWDATSIPVAVKANTTYKVTVISGEDWLSAPAEPISASAPLVLTAKKNENYTSRSAAVSLSAEGLEKSKVFTVIQNAKVSQITVVAERTIKPDDTAFYLDVTSNCKYTIAVTDGKDWLTAPVTSGVEGTGRIQFVASENTSVTARIANVAITSDDNKVTNVKVTQQGRASSISVDAEKNISWDAVALDLNVESNCKYSIAVNAAGDWLKASSASGEGNAKLQLTATANPSVTARMATVTITSEDQTVIKTVKVTQAGQPASINVTGAPKDPLAATAATLNLTVEANCEYTAEVTTGKEWVTDLKKTITKGIVNWTAAVAENKDVNARKAVITFRAVTGTDKSKKNVVVRTVEINQKGAEVTNPEPVPDPADPEKPQQ